MGCGASKKSENVASCSSLIRKGKTNTVVLVHSFCEIYDIKDRLSFSGMAEIRKCVHRESQLGRTVKIYDNVSFDASEASLNEELRAVSELDHPNIFKLFDIVYHRNNLFIVYEDWNGDLVLDFLTQQQHLTEKQIISIAEQILSALDMAHSHGIIHGDLHITQVYIVNLAESIWVKLAGFGLSKYVPKKINHYQAPEQPATSKSDLWSLGVMLYIFYTGTPPFRSMNIRENTITGPLQIDPLRRAGANPQAIDLISKMLVVDPSNRITASEALAHPWIQMYKEAELPDNILTQSIRNINVYKRKAAHKEAIQEFIASRVVRDSDYVNMEKTFKKLDMNSDGKISKQELVNFYSEKSSLAEAESKVNKILENIDTNKSGLVEYSEFIKSAINFEDITSRNNLQKAFSLLDIDSDGNLQKDELEELGADDEVLKSLIDQADKNHDGQIDLNEFVSLLLNNQR